MMQPTGLAAETCPIKNPKRQAFPKSDLENVSQWVLSLQGAQKNFKSKKDTKKANKLCLDFSLYQGFGLDPTCRSFSNWNLSCKQEV